jgi:hypothetical protein
MSPEQAESYGVARMKITTRGSDEGTSDVWVYLTEQEADQVAQALRSRLEGKAGYHGPAYHLHIADGQGSELTIAVLDPE